MKEQLCVQKSLEFGRQLYILDPRGQELDDPVVRGPHVLRERGPDSLHLEDLLESIAVKPAPASPQLHRQATQTLSPGCNRTMASSATVEAMMLAELQASCVLVRVSSELALC